MRHVSDRLRTSDAGSRFLCALTVTAAASASSSVAAARSGGGGWEFIPSPNPNETSNIRGITAVDGEHAWAVGVTNAPVGTALFVLRWDGARWSVQDAPSPGVDDTSLRDVAALAADDVWAAGVQELQDDQGFVNHEMLVLRWDGSGWEVMDTPVIVVNDAFLSDVEPIAAEDVWFAGQIQGRTLSMHWDGSNFELSAVPDIGFPLGGEAIEAVGPDDLWLVGGGSDGDFIDASIIFHGDGESWAWEPGPTPGFSSRLFDVDSTAPDDVWAVGSYTHATEPGLLILHWNGDGWTRHEVPSFAHDDGRLEAVRALGPNDVWAAGTYQNEGGSAKPLLLHYDGTEWVQVPDAPDGPEFGWFHAMATFGEGNLWAAGQLSPGTKTHTQRYRADGAGETATPTDFAVVFGSHVSGGLPELASSDDAYLRTRSAIGFTALEPNLMEVVIGAQTDVDSPSVLDVAVEERFNQPIEGTSTVRLMDWTAGAFEAIGTFPLTDSDTLRAVRGIDAADAVRADGRIEVSIKHAVVATFSAIGFDSYFDLVEIEVE